MPTKKTAESEKGAERLMEAIDLYVTYYKEAEETKQRPPLPPLMLAYQATDPEDYMAKMVSMVKSSEIEQTVLVLPFDVVVSLIEIMETLLDKSRGAVEVICRLVFI